MKNGWFLQLMQTHANESGDVPNDWIFCAGILIGPVLTVLYFVFDSTYAELFPQSQKTSAQHFLHLNCHNNAILEQKNDKKLNMYT